MSYPTFFDPLLAEPPGADLELLGPEAHHAVSVRRIRPGETVDVVNGRGLRVRGTVATAERTGLRISGATATLEPAPQVRIILVQALGKGGRDEAAIEAATEVGVDGVIAWESERSVSQWRGEKAAKGLARWEAILIAAMKQSRRSHLPELLGFARRGEITGLIPAGAHVCVLHQDATETLTTTPLPTAGVIAIVVGPEGGLSDAEISTLTGRRDARPVLLGPHVLRTSTAGPAALAVLNTRLGRW